MNGKVFGLMFFLEAFFFSLPKKQRLLKKLFILRQAAIGSETVFNQPALQIVTGFESESRPESTQ